MTSSLVLCYGILPNQYLTQWYMYMTMDIKIRLEMMVLGWYDIVVIVYALYNCAFIFYLYGLIISVYENPQTCVFVRSASR